MQVLNIISIPSTFLVITVLPDPKETDFLPGSLNWLLSLIFDTGNSALYLLSDLANGVTGEIHYVDAGYNKVGMPDPKNIKKD